MVLGGHAWWGACVVVGGMRGSRGHACWQGVCMMVGGMHGRRGACVVAGGMCGGGACVVGGSACMGYNEIQSMSGRYASYWNAFLFSNILENISTD